MPSRRGDSIPGIFEKQDQLYLNPRPPGELVQIGQLLEDNGMSVDAVEYYRVAKDQRSLERLRSAAVSEGNLFLYRAVCSAQAREQSPEELEKLAFAARSKGKDAYADDAENAMTGVSQGAD